jgi:hypothetical protein
MRSHGYINHTHTHNRMHTHAHTSCAHVHACIHTCERRIHTCTHIVCIHTRVRVCTRETAPSMRDHSLKSACVHTHVHTYMRDHALFEGARALLQERVHFRSDSGEGHSPAIPEKPRDYHVCTHARMHNTHKMHDYRMCTHACMYAYVHDYHMCTHACMRACMLRVSV